MSRRLYAIKRGMYPGGRPGAVARGLNWLSRWQFSAGVLSPHYAVTLEVVGRSSGRPIMLPLVVAEYEGERFLVSMLGPEANWVRNVRAAGGRAVLHRRGREEVRLVEVGAGDRAAILRRYLAVAPGARPHFPIDRHADLGEFEKIAERYPVFRVDAVAGNE
ncbi:nitroreductase/quinone reductase family protein [Nocardia inohanensis]|uniref:nitroreductase/quinone reductase family protein n=1 Tax=Nocardia inohanensis TaxID=209246 RepID=UPI001FDFF700|nr:nitroreductase/quinone reductase family protein [Nocardia inohanensis]